MKGRCAMLCGIILAAACGIGLAVLFIAGVCRLHTLSREGGEE